MCGLVTFMVDTAAALAKYITEQERGKSGGLTSCSCLLLKSLVDFWPDYQITCQLDGKGIKKKMSKRWIQRLLIMIGRGDRIRTCDHLVPNQERYRTALHPEYFGLRVQR